MRNLCIQSAHGYTATQLRKLGLSYPVREQAAPGILRRDTTVVPVVALGQAVLTVPQFEGLVLRYGWLYGPVTGTAVAAGVPPLHAAAAAKAAALAIDRGHRASTT